jgi:hypothetical protein
MKVAVLGDTADRLAAGSGWDYNNGPYCEGDPVVVPLDAQRSQGQTAGSPHEGTWLQERHPPGRVWFDVDVPVGEPSTWLAFYATRVLDWWDSHSDSPAA